MNTDKMGALFTLENQRLRPCELQPTLLKLAVALRVDHLRCRSATADWSYGELAHFELLIHFFDLRILLAKICRELRDA